MTRTITLAKKANIEQLSGRHEQVAKIIAQLPSIDFADLRKRFCRTMKAKRLRAVVRQLAAAKIVSVKRA